MRFVRKIAVAALLMLFVGLAPAAEVDPQAAEIAEQVMQKMGGRAAWDATRFVRWKFFGGRQHYWDKQSGDIRIEMDERRDESGELQRPQLLILMNVHNQSGQVWAAGEAVEDAEKLAGYLELGHQAWVNDAYWMFMPYKLLDPGVNLGYLGEKLMEDGRLAHVLDLTFESEIGYTPKNRYHVWIPLESGLVEAWTFFSDASDEEPGFTMPWAKWRQFGDIRLATDHGRGKNWDIAVDEEILREFFKE